MLAWASSVAQNILATRETWVRSRGWEDPLEDGHGNPLEYSCLENSMDRGMEDWQATAYWVAKGQT